MQIIRYQSPFVSAVAPLSDLQDEMARLFDVAFPNLSQFQRGNSPVRGQEPSLDLFQDKEAFYARVETPGFSREDLSIDVSDGVVNVTAHHKAPTENGKSVTQERKYTRAFSIPSHTDVEKISARYENGVLTLTLPKKEESKPRSISVEVK